LNDFLAGMTRFLVRAMLVALGLVFFLSLLAAAMLLALVWGLRALWARLTGQPVTPWAMRMDPRAGWSAVYRSRTRWAATRAEATEEAPAPGARMRVLPGAGEVTDVQPHEPRQP
jgi:hypothetical protein